MNWADVQVTDAVIFEHGSTIVSGVVIDVYRDSDEQLQVVVDHFGVVAIDFWVLTMILKQKEITGVEEPSSQEA